MSGSTDEGAAPEQWTCPACGAIAAEGAVFCTGCGERIEARPKRRSRRAAGDAAERARGRNEFGRIKSIVLTVRSVFLSGVVYAVVQVALAHTIDAVALERLSSGLRLTLFAMVYGLLALTVAGSLLVLRAPLIWTIVGACYWSLDVALSFWVNEGAMPPALLVKTFMLLAFWFAVGQAARVEKLMAADPSLRIVRQRIAADRRVVGGVGDEARQRRKEERRRMLVGRVRMVAIVVVALTVLGFAYRAWTAPPAAAETLARFAANWAQRDVDAIAVMFDGGAESRLAGDWLEEVERRGWRGAMPAAGPPQNTESDTEASVRLAVDGGEVRAAFERHDKQWVLRQVLLPTMPTPDLKDAVAEFRRAWATPGTEALVAMFRPASRDRLGAATVRLLGNRQWQDQRPALGDVDPGKPRAGRARVLFAIGNDEVGVSFDYWHPRWWMSGLSLPRQ